MEITIKDAVSEAQKLEDLTGMGNLEETQPEVKPEVKEETKEEVKPEVKAEEAKTEEETDTEEVDDDEVGEPKRAEKPNKAAKNERPMRALFSQIKELRGMIESLKTAPAQKAEVADAIDEISQIAEKRNLDSEGLAEIIALTEKRILDNLEKTGKLNKDLPADVQDKLKLLDQYKSDLEAKEIEASYEREYNAFLPDLQKQYPNAKASELSAAKEKLDELSHSKEWRDKDLDYVVYKNKSIFDTLLKVAKFNKSGETSSKQMNDGEVSEDVDLDPENMTPDKMSNYLKKKHGV